MDYYEELGLNRTATEEEIRRAHRRFAKLLHPDQQTDDTMKQLAETQMRRLNAIVETLCDPEKRQQYDDALRPPPPALLGGRLRRGMFHSWPWWVASTAGAVILTVGAVWFSADKWGSSFGDRAPTYIPSGAETSSDPGRNSSLTEVRPGSAHNPSANEVARAEPPNTPAPDEPQTPPSPPSRTIAKVPAPGEASPGSKPESGSVPDKVQRDKLQPEQSRGAVLDAALPRGRKKLTLPLTAVSARPAASGVNLPAAPALSTPSASHIEPVALPSASLPAAPNLPDPVNSARTISPANPHDALEGEWVYAPTEPEKRKAGFYPPEYIDLKIWNNGGLHGEYRARYHVSDKPIPPDVSFSLAPDGNPRHFTWESSNGSKGTLKVSSMDAGSIRIEWRTTVFSRGIALTAGTATLVRRTP